MHTINIELQMFPAIEDVAKLARHTYSSIYVILFANIRNLKLESFAIFFLLTESICAFFFCSFGV